MKYQPVSTYEAGIRKCPICDSPLPAHQTWPGARYRFCMKPECMAKVKESRCDRYIGLDQQKCERDGCTNFVPEGLYRSRPTYLTCSAECWHRRNSKGKPIRNCDCGCGQQVLRRCKRKSVTGQMFVSPKHHGNYQINKHLAQRCGLLLNIVDEYLKGFAALHYSDVSKVRNGISPFFLFLNKHGIESLEKVTPQTITQYLIWAEEAGHRNSAHDISIVSTFFKWMIAEGRRKNANPVVGLIHNQPKKHRKPRPLTANEIAFAWQLLRERGDARLRLAAAIAEEAGLRISEICNLLVEDVQIMERRLFVRLPTKTKRERFAFFSHKTSQYFQEWMQERDPNCGHDFLLYNCSGNPYRATILAKAFNRALCKTFRGREPYEKGFDRWSTHRLRHTMATNLVAGGADAATVMAAGGWVTYESMAGYAEVDPAIARRGYQEAMRRAQDQKQIAPRNRVLTPAELLDRRQPKAVKYSESRDTERCV